MSEFKLAPSIETHLGAWQVNAGSDDITVNVSANQTVEIDKLYGPLAALGVRVRLEYRGDISDWVVERERPTDKRDGGSAMEWVEMARWDCQLDWWEDEK